MGAGAEVIAINPGLTPYALAPVELDYDLVRPRRGGRAVIVACEAAG